MQTGRTIDPATFDQDRAAWLEQIHADRALSDSAFRLAYHVSRAHLNRKPDRNCKTVRFRPSHATLASALGWSVRTVQRALADLIAAGHLTLLAKGGPGHPCVYAPCLHAKAPSATPDTNVACSGEHRTILSATPDTNVRLTPTLNPFPPLPPQRPADAFAALKRLWPFPVGSPAWIHARSSFDRCVAAGKFDLPAFLAALPNLRSLLGKEEDPPSPQRWIIRRAWLDGPKVIPFAPPTREAA